MLVDDHRTVLWGLAKLIDGEKPRMEVVGTATNCAEAIDLADRVGPDVIVLDIDLGKQSGVDAIPDFIARAGTRVLVLTGLRDGSLHDQAVLAGARGIVHKEDPPETILKAIEKIFEGELWLDRVTTGRMFIELSRTGRPRQDPEKVKRSLLTARERELIGQLVANPSANYRKIAGKLHISEHTVRNYLTSIYSKLGVINRLELFVYANKNELRSPSAAGRGSTTRNPAGRHRQRA
jgi:two-component system, NarL family, nitrate/nitrite response regulator NarL